MTIRQQGGIFGRNPTFNDVDIEGTLTVNGEPISDFGTMAQQDANNVNIDGGAIDGVSLGTNSVVTEAQVDNININGNTISATNTNGGVIVAPNGTGAFNTPSDFRLSGSEKYAYFLSSSGIGSNDRGKIRAVYAGGGSGYGGDLRLSSRQQNNVWNEDALIIRNDGNIAVSGNLVISTSGKGIDFSATAGTGTSELFDDYEEGVWSPGISDGTTNATATTSLGAYTKTGNRVILNGYVGTTSVSGLSAGAQVRITGLPFTVKNGNDSYGGTGAGLGGGLNITAGSTIGVVTLPNQTYLSPRGWTATTGVTDFLVSQWSNSGSLMFTLSYRTA